MSFLFTMFGFTIGATLVLLCNPVQVLPRFLRSVRLVLAERVGRRIRSDCAIKQDFWQLSAAAVSLLLLLFLVGARAVIPDSLLPTRTLTGILAGLMGAWTLLRRQEILVSSVGVVGLYPNPRLIVSWSELSGFAIDERYQAVLLINQSGQPVETLPYTREDERRQLELALLPYLSRQDYQPQAAGAGRLPANVRLSLRAGFVALFFAILPLATCFWQLGNGQESDGRLLFASILLALALPLAVLNWSLRLRLLYYCGLGHVQIAHITSFCRKCHYQSVCWQAGLHQQLRWQPGIGAVLPSYEQFSGQSASGADLDMAVYQVCCQCLLGHLHEQDIYQVDLHPLADETRV